MSRLHDVDWHDSCPIVLTTLKVAIFHNHYMVKLLEFGGYVAINVAVTSITSCPTIVPTSMTNDITPHTPHPSTKALDTVNLLVCRTCGALKTLVMIHGASLTK